MKKLICSIKDKVLFVYMTLAAVALIVMIFACFYQVFGRYILNASPGWTEELSRFTFIWMSALGSAVALDKGSHAAITVLAERLPQAPRKVLDLILQIVIGVLAVLMIIYGWKLAAATVKTPSAALKIPMSWVNISITFAGIGMLISTIAKVASAFGKEDAA